MLQKSDVITEVSLLNPALSDKQVKKVVDDVFDTIKGYLRTEQDVTIMNFGKFYTTEHKERRIMNIGTGEHEIVPPTLLAKCSMSKVLLTK